MDFEKIWEKIIQNVKEFPREIQTIPITKNKIGVWFYVESINDEIFISKAKDNTPASNINSRTHISKYDFKRMYPVYLRRCKGEKVSKEAQAITRFQIYIYAIFKNCGGI